MVKDVKTFSYSKDGVELSFSLNVFDIERTGEIFIELMEQAKEEINSLITKG